MLIIKEVCKRLGVSSTELADRLGVSKASVSQYLNGNPTAERLEAIAEALGVHVGDLFSDSEDGVTAFIKVGSNLYTAYDIGELIRLLENITGCVAIKYEEDLFKHISEYRRAQKKDAPPRLG